MLVLHISDKNKKQLDKAIDHLQAGEVTYRVWHQFWINISPLEREYVNGIIKHEGKGKGFAPPPKQEDE